jgi:hypothetical protein
MLPKRRPCYFKEEMAKSFLCVPALLGLKGKFLDTIYKCIKAALGFLSIILDYKFYDSPF